MAAETSFGLTEAGTEHSFITSSLQGEKGERKRKGLSRKRRVKREERQGRKEIGEEIGEIGGETVDTYCVVSARPGDHSSEASIASYHSYLLLFCYTLSVL